MSIADGLISGTGVWLAHLLYGLMLLVALWRAPWAILHRNSTLQHLVLGATVLVMMMWLLRAGISPGMSVHFLGVTTLTLMFGWELGILSSSLALLGMTLIGKEALDGISINGLCASVIPACWSYWALRQVERWLPQNFFVYLIIGVFLNAACAAALSGIAMMGVLWGSGTYSFYKIWQEYVILLPLIMPPEGLLNGILMTAMMVHHPDWIRTFDARRYIDEQ